MTQQIDRYAVFGNPIGHSKSPFIHTLFARQTNQSLSYTAECAPVDGFIEAVTAYPSLRFFPPIASLPPFPPSCPFSMHRGFRNKAAASDTL